MVPVAYDQVRVPIILPSSVAGKLRIKIYLLTPGDYLVSNANNLLKKHPNKKVTLWFVGSRPEDISKYTIKLAETLKNNAPNKLNWKHSNEPNEKHNTIFRATKEKALKWVLNEQK